MGFRLVIENFKILMIFNEKPLQMKDDLTASVPPTICTEMNRCRLRRFRRWIILLVEQLIRRKGVSRTNHDVQLNKTNEINVISP